MTTYKKDFKITASKQFNSQQQEAREKSQKVLETEQRKNGEQSTVMHTAHNSGCSISKRGELEMVQRGMTTKEYV